MPAYGGQAVIEGVLMRGKKSVAMANRTPDGEIVIHQEPLSGLYKKDIFKVPFLRGLISLWDAMVLGMKFLTMSANIQTGEDEKLEGFNLYLTIGFSLLIGVGLFFLAPAALAGALENWLGMSSWISNLFEGLLRLVLLITYLVLVGNIPDIKRTFAYHGAEHKTINTFEANIELTPENVMKQSTIHPRCGTSFILSLVLVSILLFSIIGPLPLHWRLILRLLMIPVVAGIAYEYIRWTALHQDIPFVRFIIQPNLALQKLTTREPDKDMVEVSIKAFETMYTIETNE